MMATLTTIITNKLQLTVTVFCKISLYCSYSFYIKALEMLWGDGDAS
jgi:hypothetical protein